jgi:NADH-quinone oxidoreductase subunit J
VLISPETVAGTVAPMPPPEELSNTAAIGMLLYTRYIFFFQMAGMILLVAMIGAIVLTLRHKEGVPPPGYLPQVARTPEMAVEVVHVETGKGIP